jgi:uroporphyrinogen decarboxylase
VVGLDWTVSLARARQRVGDKVALQGNLDPMVLFGGEAAVRAEARRVLDDFGAGPGHIFNLGHGIHQLTPPESVAALVDEVHRQSRIRHAN